jgi:hypothetical protein
VSGNAKAMKSSVRLLHRMMSLGRETKMVSFCCEGQPLATIRNYGFPSHCPICRQADPLRCERQVEEHRDKKGNYSR